MNVGMMAAASALAGVLAAAGPATAQLVPECVATAQKTEARAPSTVPPPPSIDPISGRPGTPVRIEAPGFAPGTIVTFVALFGERDCTIAGLGDQFLGQATAGPDGVALLARAWPDRFEPLFGRGGFDPTDLPPGRYWLVATACERRGACSLASGSQAGGPFRVLGGDGPVPVVAAVAGLALSGAGIVALVRRRRRR